jgi:hypothetical protein
MQLKSYAVLAATSMLALSTVATVYAHERRILPTDHGSIQLVVGSHVEPAFEDSYNAVDVIPATSDGTCPDGTTNLGQSIDVNGTASNADPDTIKLKVETLYLRKSVPPGNPPVGNIPPAGILKRLWITDYSPLAEAFSTPGLYDSWFRPTNPGDGTYGAYSYHVKGTVHAGPNSITCPGGSSTPHPLAARTAKIDAYFVCGVTGSLVPPDAFGCITRIQPFPGDAADGYEPSPPFGLGY